MLRSNAICPSISIFLKIITCPSHEIHLFRRHLQKVIIPPLKRIWWKDFYNIFCNQSILFRRLNGCECGPDFIKSLYRTCHSDVFYMFCHSLKYMLWSRAIWHHLIPRFCNKYGPLNSTNYSICLTTAYSSPLQQIGTVKLDTYLKLLETV